MTAITPPAGPQQDALGQVVLWRAAHGLRRATVARHVGNATVGRESWLLARPGAWNWLESSKNR